MNISFSPMRREGALNLLKSGDILTINGEVFDFSEILDGATLPQEAVDCIWLASDVARIDGVIHLVLILPHGTEAPQETLFPQPVIAMDGPIAVPAPSLQDPEAET